MMCLHVLIVHIFINTSLVMTRNAVEDTTINRVFRDIFKIPSAMCQNDIEKQCNSMGATQRTKRGNIKVVCTCHCKFNTTNNVFGWFDNQWKCEKNSAVRNYNLAGCPLKTFEGKTVNSNLSTVQPKKNTRRKIGEIPSQYIKLCSLESSYLDCTSTWQKIHNNYFVLDGTGRTFNKYELYIKTKTYIGNEQINLYGRVIKLEIKCKDKISNVVRFCVVFKVKGNQTCPVIYPTTSTPTIAAKPSISSKAQTTSTQARPTTEKQITTMSTIQVSTTNSITSTLLSPTKQDKTAMSTNQLQASTTDSITTSNPLPPTKQSSTEVTTREPKLTNKTDNPKKHNRESTDTADDSGIIAGAIGGVAVLVAVLVILVVIWFKRKRNSPNKRTADNETVENRAYDGVVRDNSSERPGQQTSADDEYSYAYTNTHPVVIRDQYGKALQVPHFSNGHIRNINDSTGSPSSSDFPIYNTLEDPDYAELSKTKDTNSGPSYNVLERRPEANWNKTYSASGSSEAPIYNTLEDPDYAKPEKSDVGIGPSFDILEGPEDKREKAQGSPFYDLLENPNSTGSPVYDVLEQPESDEQHVYGSLQNNDPHIYGALQSRTLHNGEANSEYDDNYNLAGDVIHYDVDGDVYQELNQDRQRSSDDVYEPLRHSGC